MRLLRKLRRFAASVTVVLLGAGGLGAAAAVVSPPANAATGCSVAYTVPSQWNTGFTANIVITNLGSPLTSWNLGYSYGGNQTLQSGWNGTWTQSGANVTVANASWNGSVATNGTVTIGANFNYSGTNTSPTTFTLNGVTCTGSITGTTGAIQASATTLSVAQGHTGTVGISLSAAPSANVTVSTARTSGNTGLSVSGGSSLTFTPSNFATAQNVTFTADASSTGSATFTVSAAGYPSITITVTRNDRQHYRQHRGDIQLAVGHPGHYRNGRHLAVGRADGERDRHHRPYRREHRAVRHRRAPRLPSPRPTSPPRRP